MSAKSTVHFLASSEGSSYQRNKMLLTSYYDLVAEDASIAHTLCPELRALSEITSRYDHETPIGRGALKEVFKCFDRRTKRYVALTYPAKKLGAEFFDLFLQEAWLTSSLSHPNIIKVYDTGITDTGRPYFTMDLKSNTTLKSLKEKTDDLKVLLGAFLKICDAIYYAHSKGIIHMDIKPENIQCDQFGEVLVCDWGLAKKIGEEDASEVPSTEHLTLTQHETLFGEVKGTLGYMAPEQILPDSDKTRATDIFALGCLLHFILLGEAPFTGSKKDIIKQTLQVDLQGSVIKLKALKLPKSLSAIMLQALEADPQDRYGTVGHLRDDVERFLHGFATRAERPNLIRQSALFLKRHQRSAGIGLFALIVLAIFGWVSWSLLTEEKVRSESLAEEVEELTEEYGLFEDLPTWSKEKITENLVEESLEFTELFWQEDSVVAVRENRELLRQIYKHQPDNPRLVGYLCRVDYFMMNFKSVLAYPDLGSPLQNEKRSHAQLCPDYAFTESHRPSVDELCYFYQQARVQIKEGSGSFDNGRLFSVMKYDSATRKDWENYHQVVAALLRAINPRAVIKSAPSAAGASQLSISSKRYFFSGVDVFEKRYHVFRYLQVDRLELKLPSFRLSELRKAKIRYLDLSGVEKLELRKVVYIDGLEEIILPPSISERQIRASLKSDRPFQVIRN